MALTSISTSTSSGGPQPPKAISVVHYNATNAFNTIYYTVPVGRKFKGVAWVNSTSYNLGKFPGHVGGENHPNIATTNTIKYFPIETGPGDFVSGNSSYAYHSVVGIETDA